MSPRHPARWRASTRQKARFEARLARAADPRLGEASFNVGRLAEALGMSVRTLQLRMQKLDLPTPVVWLLNHRLAHARLLLDEQAFETVAEVARAVGLSPSYFSRAFTAHTGTPPSELLRC